MHIVMLRPITSYPEYFITDDGRVWSEKRLTAKRAITTPRAVLEYIFRLADEGKTGYAIASIVGINRGNIYRMLKRRGDYLTTSL